MNKRNRQSAERFLDAKNRLIKVAKEVQAFIKCLPIISCSKVCQRSWFLLERSHRDMDVISPLISSIACKKGCHWCCGQLVETNPAEVFHIAKFLKESLDADQLEKIKQQIVSLDEETHGMHCEQRTNKFCVFLIDHACSIYSVRPLACRNCFSYSEEYCRKVCERTLQSFDLPTYTERSVAVRYICLGLKNGLKSRHLDERPLEMIAALRIALENTELEKKWLDGDHNVFDSAVITPSPNSVAFQ